MAKYHINSKGNPALCRATKGKCPFGGADQHFESQQEAYAHAEKIHEQEAMNPNRRDLPDGFVEVLSESEKNGRKTTTSRQHLDTGDLQTDTYFKGASRHRDGDEPARVVYDKNGRIHSKEYMKNGVFHRESGPARQFFNHNGEVVREEWYLNGKLHRTDGAAIVVHNSDGTPKIEEWFQSGQRHRDDGPAKILHSRSFVVEEYFRDDRRHRDGAPAVVSTRSDGTPINEEWYQDGQLHRGDGPAQTYFFENGGKREEVWYQNGKIQSFDEQPAWKTYGLDGSLVSDSWYRDDKKWRGDDKPASVEYFPDGSIKRETWFAGDGIPGRFEKAAPFQITYDKTGNVVGKRW